MKEFILLPKATAERLTKKGHTPSQTCSNVSLPNSEQHGKVKRVRRHLSPESNVKKPTTINKLKHALTVRSPYQVNLSLRKSKTKTPPTKPDLSSLIPLYATSEINATRIQALLNEFQKNPQIMWDAYGNITSPIQFMNILHMLKKLIDVKGAFTAEELPHVKFLAQLSRLNPEYVKNPKSRKQIYGGTRRDKKRIVWEPY